jgi:hypothetical protein
MLGIGNVNGVVINTPTYAVVTETGNDIGAGGFIDNPGALYSINHPATLSAYAAGLINLGTIALINTGTPNAAGFYGPGNYVGVFAPNSLGTGGAVYGTLSAGDQTGHAVAIDNASNGPTYLINKGRIIGGAAVSGVQTVIVQNYGWMDGIYASGRYGTVLNAGTIAAAGLAIDSDVSVINTGIILNTATTATGELVLAQAAVTNSGTIMGAVSGTAVSNSGLISGASGFAIDAPSVTNTATGTITSSGTASYGAAIYAASTITNPAFVSNAGIIISTGTGIELGTGTINNLAKATIQAAGSLGVSVRHGGVINNAGTIAATGKTGANSAAGVQAAGGTITNQASAVISSAFGAGVDAPQYRTSSGHVYGSKVVNYGTILSPGGAAGVIAAGDVINATGGTIAGLRFGAALYDATAFLSNAGTIEASPTLTLTMGGVGLSTSASNAYVTNAASAVIYGGDGVFDLGSNGMVVNDGLIEGAAKAGAGIMLGAGGTVMNQGFGTITSPDSFASQGRYVTAYGVVIKGSTGSVTNTGIIYGHNAGVELLAGGTVINMAAATIGSDAVLQGTLNTDIVLGGTAASTLINGGTIGSTGATVMASGITAAGALYLHNLDGGRISGTIAVQGSGATTLLNAGTITAAGSVANPGAVRSGDVMQGVVLNGTIGTDYVTNATGGLIYGYDGVDISTALATVVNAGTIGAYFEPPASGTKGTVTALNGAGIVMGGGGSLSNSGVIASRVSYYLADPTTMNAAATLNVTNSGTILGVVLPSGTLSNQAGGQIADVILNQAGSIINAGTITYQKIIPQVLWGFKPSAIELYGSGTANTVINLSGGLIASTATAYVAGHTLMTSGGVHGSTGTVINQGLITAAGGYGVRLTQSGLITNAGTISALGTGIWLNAGTVINTGTVSATGQYFSGTYFYQLYNRTANSQQLSATSVYLKTGTLLNYGVLKGSVLAGAGGATTITNEGRIFADTRQAVEIGAGTLTNEAGAYILASNYASVWVSDGGTVVNAGVIKAVGTNSAVAFLQPGQLVVEPGATFIGAITGPSTIEFTAGKGSLGGFGSTITGFGSIVLDPGAAWTLEGTAASLANHPIIGFAQGDTLDIAGFSAQSESFLNGVLNLTSTSDAVIAVVLPGSTYGSANFALFSDGAGGTDITANPAGNVVVTAGASGTVTSGETLASATINGGALTLDSGGSVQGSISFTGTGGTLLLEPNAGGTITLPQSPLVGFGPGDTLVLGGVPYVAGQDSATVITAGTVQIDAAGTIYNVPVAGATVGERNFSLSGDLTLTETNALCFAKGTRLLTPQGEMAVEALRIGDLVTTAAGAALPVKWIGRRDYDGRFIAGNVLALPVCIRQNAIAAGVPRRDLTVSPGHGIWTGAALVPAWRLVNGRSITQAEAVERVSYYHVELATHELLVAEGCPAESFYDLGTRALFQNLAEYAALYPDDSAPGPALPRADEGVLVHALQRCLAARAGILPAAAPPGALRGGLDSPGPGLVAGWAQDVSQPEEPVTVDVWMGGTLLARVLANRYRPDLRKAGLGSGCHGFAVTVPAGISGAVEVRRASDQARLEPLAASRQRALR